MFVPFEPSSQRPLSFEPLPTGLCGHVKQNVKSVKEYSERRVPAVRGMMNASCL